MFCDCVSQCTSCGAQDNPPSSSGAQRRQKTDPCFRLKEGTPPWSQTGPSALKREHCLGPRRCGKDVCVGGGPGKRTALPPEQRRWPARGGRCRLTTIQAPVGRPTVGAGAACCLPGAAGHRGPGRRAPAATDRGSGCAPDGAPRLWPHLPRCSR